jgi:hypothetical protein
MAKFPVYPNYTTGLQIDVTAVRQSHFQMKRRPRNFRAAAFKKTDF